MSYSQSFITELKSESKLTEKILSMVPMDQASWKPHEKSMTIGRLATHIAEIPHWITVIGSASEFDFATRPYNPRTVVSTEDLLFLFKENVAEAIAVLEKMSEDDFEKIWTVKRGEHVFMQPAKKTAIRGWAYSHLYHHRGQLSVYLRLLNVPVPGMYGPSADEQ
jgi:uncharacterized damage-inducible protein DinB